MTWNPLDWTAGPFLALYLTTATLIFVLGYHFRSTIGPAANATRQLNALELAYLGGGARRLGDVILLGLTSGNGATIAPGGRTITVTDQTPLTTLMRNPASLAVQPDMSRQQFQTAVKPIVRQIQGRLQQLGYAPSDEQMTSFHMTVLPFVGLLLGLGLVKAAVGAERHHPVGILIVLLIVTVIGGIMLAQRPVRTRAGDEVLASHQVSNARASRAPRDHELLLAVALSGAVVLSGTPYAPVYAASQTMSSGGSGGDGGGGCGGGGGGGGGCGGCS
ncbi:TIGR04222 domain-containing membrane protein [Bradyrhizobium sp. CCGUVB1N3]|uniref:TIGR04222 domain-containing membrane protein n=1 Tax=Bradyrhizobium sp. CCGUVB1N3 TaxID=2949629 RepID=UPI0020B2B839|nr:TIGR04222 domain-containing membrane protein [Bradyrhizobium sp. CCGUVB1N3]MCP3473989.1 TIGR04222 domain-containing membrane protein [Bradyrhizobium sp. CCGUVB1N3]